MTEEFRKAMIELDELAEEAGGYVQFTPPSERVDFDIRGCDAYAKEKGVAPSELTEEERNMFIRSKPDKKQVI